MPTHRVVKLDELSQYFHMPEKMVAKQLGVCLTSLKKICRQNGITRWPYRKLKSLDKKINKIENALTSTAEDPSAMLMKWEMLKLEKKNLPFQGNSGDESDADSHSKRSPVENTGPDRASQLTTPHASPPHHEPEWNASLGSHPSSSSSLIASSVISPGSRSFHSLLERKLRQVGCVNAHREAMALKTEEQQSSLPQTQVQRQPMQQQPPRLQQRASMLAVDDVEVELETDIPVPLDAMMTDDERARLVDMYCNPLDSARSGMNSSRGLGFNSFRLPDMLSPANAANPQDASDIFGDFAFPSCHDEAAEVGFDSAEFLATA